MQNNNGAKFSEMFIVRLFVFMMIVAALASVPRLTATAEVLAAPTCEVGTHQVTGQCVADVLPAAEDTEAGAPLASSLDYATESVLIVEGQNPDMTPVVKATFPNGANIWIPEEDPNGGHQTRMWLDDSPLYSGGWLLQINGETSATRWLDVQERLAVTEQDEQSTEYGGPAYGTEQDAAQVQTVAYSTPVADAPATFSRQCVRAARKLWWASVVGVRIEEDLSYRHMPSTVADCNDDLATAFYADGHDFTGQHGKALRTFLRHVIKTGQAPQVQTPGKVRAEDGSLVPHSFYDHVAGPTQATCDRLGKRLVPDTTFGTRCA